LCDICGKNLHEIIFYSALLAGCATTGEKPKFSKHYADSLFKIAESGLYSVEMVIPDRELSVGRNAVNIIVHDKNDAEVMGAGLTITPWMPEMGHGVLEEPEIVERGGGLYSIENVVISMPGRWELRIKVVKDGVEDRAVFDFPGVRSSKMHEMEHGHETMKPPPHIDTSRARTSEGGLFMVSYESEIDPIKINRFHSWRVTVKTADGEPVDYAEIAIDGDMPEHGHGMPTRPWVTEKLGGGVYLVEGMKFQMPGWWVVDLTIRAGAKEEKVRFNLMLK
jgi:hypothetical protein